MPKPRASFHIEIADILPSKVSLLVEVYKNVSDVRKAHGDKNVQCFAFCGYYDGEAPVRIALPATYAKLRCGLIAHEVAHAVPRLLTTAFRNAKGKKKKGDEWRVNEETYAELSGRLVQAIVEGFIEAGL